VHSREALAEALARDGAAIWAPRDDAAGDNGTAPAVLAAELPWALLGASEVVGLTSDARLDPASPNFWACRASLAPTEIRMQAAADGGPAQAVTYDASLQAQGQRHARFGTDQGNKSKTTNLALDPCHVDGAKAYGSSAPDVIFLLCERACQQGGGNFVVDGAALVQELAAEDPELGEAIFSRPVTQVYYSVTATGKGEWTAPLASKTPFGRVQVLCPNVFECDDPLERVRPCADSPSPELDERLIRAFAAKMRKAQDDAPRFRTSEGQTLVIDNYRMWHGREPFYSLDRTLWRVWAWTVSGNELPPDVQPGRSERRDCEV